MDLNRPPDLLSPGKYPFLKNVHSYQEGRLETRAPVSQINSVASSPDTNIVSSFRVNDYVVGNFKRFLKIGSSLYYGDDTSITHLDDGYSADAFTPVAYRPDQSARVWAYLADPTKMRKANTSGENFSIGIAPPTIIPTAELGLPLYYALDTTGPSTSPFDSATGWGNALSAQAVVLNNSTTSAGRLIGASIAQILYDTGTTGWCCVFANDVGAILAGMRIILNSGETVTVEDVHTPYANGAGVPTVAQIVYDNGGTTGLCTIQPSVPITNLNRNAMLNIGGVFVRVLSVTVAQDGTYSFRTKPSSTLTVGMAISIAPSFRIYTTINHSVGETIRANDLEFVTKPSIAGPQGFVYINFGAGNGFNLNYVGNRPITVNDYLHLGILCFNPENLVEIKLVLDVDSATTSTFNPLDGTQNAYTVSVRPSDFQGSVNSSSGIGPQQTTVAARLTGTQIQQNNQEELKFSSNIPGGPGLANPAQQLALGSNQFTEFRWKLADLIRIGSAQALDLSSVNAIQIWVTCTNPLTDGTDCVIRFANLYVAGGYGADTGKNFTPFMYRYRYRSSETGAHSLPSPAMRSGITSLRQQILLTGVSSTDPQVDKIDWERFGGESLPGQPPTWHYIGTGLNSAPTFTDIQETAALLVNPPLDTTAYQPFPISDVPRKIIATIAGSAALATGGDSVNQQWAIGTALIINGQATSLYATPIGNVLQLADSMPSGTGVTIEIPEPVIAAQPLPALWGPYNESLFACGNALDAGSVYWTNPTDPDSAPDTNRVEVCSPSEALVNGCVFDSRLYVFSDKRMFALVPAFRTSFAQIAQSADYNVVQMPNSKGLWERHALAVGPKIWFLSDNGIYETDGGNTVKISGDINPLFPDVDRAGYQAGTPGAVFYPINMVSTAGYSPRLAYHQGLLFFDYQDCHGTPITMVYDVAYKAWYSYNYFEGTSIVVNFHEHEEGFQGSYPSDVSNLIIGTNAGFLYVSDGSGSGVETINCRLRSPSLDEGDSRAKKIYGDIVYDMDCQGVNVLATPYIFNYAQALPGTTYATLYRQITPPADLVNGVGQFARNLGVEISWSLAT